MIGTDQNGTRILGWSYIVNTWTALTHSIQLGLFHFRLSVISMLLWCSTEVSFGSILSLLLAGCLGRYCMQLLNDQYHALKKNQTFIEQLQGRLVPCKGMVIYCNAKPSWTGQRFRIIHVELGCSGIEDVTFTFFTFTIRIYSWFKSLSSFSVTFIPNRYAWRGKSLSSHFAGALPQPRIEKKPCMIMVDFVCQGVTEGRIQKSIKHMETDGNQVCWCLVKYAKIIQGGHGLCSLLAMVITTARATLWECSLKSKKKAARLASALSPSTIWILQCPLCFHTRRQLPRPQAAESLNAWHVDGTFYAVAAHCGAWCWEGHRTRKECCRHHGISTCSTQLMYRDNALMCLDESKVSSLGCRWWIGRVFLFFSQPC